MKITGDFPGGNIEVAHIDGDTVHLKNQLRDTTADWFYWAFRIEGAEGRTLTFTFDGKSVVGYWGAAVSGDTEHWQWSGWEGTTASSFTYAFGEKDHCLYFCHDMNYTFERFERLTVELALPVCTLAVSEQGRNIPLVRLGEAGCPALLLTSRHHCCESTGTYLLEGMLREFSQYPPCGFQVLAVPFVDLDGAVNGDQGKDRFPHDHNRDYIDTPVYRSTAAIMKLAQTEDIRWTLDLHAPAHQGHEHDYCYLLRTEENASTLRETFSRLLEEETRLHPEAFPFCHNFGFERYHANAGSCTYYFSHRPGTVFAGTIETTYAGNYWRKVSADNLRGAGHARRNHVSGASSLMAQYRVLHPSGLLRTRSLRISIPVRRAPHLIASAPPPPPFWQADSPASVRFRPA